jgi:hypothetical protein
MRQLRSSARLFAVGVAVAVGWPAGARAEEPGTPAADHRSATERGAKTGSFLSLVEAATRDGQTAYGVGTGGYDSARGTALFEAAAEARVWGPISVRGGAVYTTRDRQLRPAVGARVQALTQARHGVDATVGLSYRPEGLTEAEGELEALVAVGGRAGATYLGGNLLYGQDPEGHERDGELRLALTRPVLSSLFLGWDSRLRLALGGSGGAGEPTLDALAGPAATVLAGPVALLVQGGASAVRLRGAPVAYGAFVLGGVGAAF